MFITAKINNIRDDADSTNICDFCGFDSDNPSYCWPDVYIEYKPQINIVYDSGVQRYDKETYIKEYGYNNDLNKLDELLHTFDFSDIEKFRIEDYDINVKYCTNCKMLYFFIITFSGYSPSFYYFILKDKDEKTPLFDDLSVEWFKKNATSFRAHMIS